MDYQTGNVTLESSDVRYSWGMWSNQSPDGVELDIEKRLVSFRDAESDEVLVSFTMDELHDLDSRGQILETEAGVAFSFSPDAKTWSLQDLGDEIGDEARVFDLEVTDESVVALIGPRGGWVGTRSAVDFEIWSAEIPDAGSLESVTSQ